MPKKTLTRHYSGGRSREFWRQVNALPSGPWSEGIYFLGCTLQDLEARTLQMLADAQQVAEEQVSPSD